MDVSPTKTGAGFTLIELALAALLVGIGLLALITLGRNAARAAMEAEDELRATALAEDVFATLRAASTEMYQAGGYEKCLVFWNLVTNTSAQAREDIANLGLETEGMEFLLEPSFGEMDRDLDDEPVFRFYHSTFDEPDNRYRHWHAEAPLWEALYFIQIELKNFYGAELPPDFASVTVSVKPRVSHLATVETMAPHSEYLTFSTRIPLEPMRMTLFSEIPGEEP